MKKEAKLKPPEGFVFPGENYCDKKCPPSGPEWNAASLHGDVYRCRPAGLTHKVACRKKRQPLKRASVPQKP